MSRRAAFVAQRQTTCIWSKTIEVVGLIPDCDFLLFLSLISRSLIRSLDSTYFPKKWMAIIVPFLALWASSMVLDNVFFAQYYDSFQWFSQPFVFLAFGLTIGLGWLMLKKVKPANLLVASLISSAIFFLVTNFGHWVMFSPDKTWASLTAVYVAGVPFIRGTVLGDLVYVGILFGAFEWMKRSVPALRTEQA